MPTRRRTRRRSPNACATGPTRSTRKPARRLRALRAGPDRDHSRRRRRQPRRALRAHRGRAGEAGPAAPLRLSKHPRDSRLRRSRRRQAVLDADDAEGRRRRYHRRAGHRHFQARERRKVADRALSFVHRQGEQEPALSSRAPTRARDSTPFLSYNQTVKRRSSQQICCFAITDKIFVSEIGVAQ